VKKFFLIAISVTSLSACATMFNGGTQTIVVNPTNPEHEPMARITTSEGSVLTQLPATVASSPSTFTNVEVSIQDKCYEPITVEVGKTIAGSYWANIFNVWAYAIGFLVDPLTGYMWNLDSQVTVPTRKKKECEITEETKES